MSLEQLGNVEVTTATKTPEQVWNTAAAIYVITQEDIRRSGASCIPDALRLAPGVEVARIDSNKWSIGIRGFGSRLSRDVLVLIDGRTVYTTLLAGTYWEVQNLMLQDVDHIEVIRGPGATIWGPNALNGVINIITKSTKETHGTFVSAGGGNLNQGFLNVRYGGGNDHGFNYRAYGLAFDRGAQFHRDRDYYDGWRDVQGGFRMDWERNQDTFTLQGDIYDEGAGETVTAVTYAPPYSQVVRGTEILSGGNLVGRWQRTFAEGKSLQLQMFYERANRREPNFTDLRDTYDVDFLDRFRLRRQQISWGFGARASDGKNPTVVSGLFFRPSSRTDQLYSLFIQDEVGIVPDQLSLSLGSKLIKTNYTGAQLQPTARVLWTPTKHQTVWLAFTHALRTPSDAERAFFLTGLVGVLSSGTPIFARFNANPNFHSEQLNGYEIGYRRLISRQFYFDTALFYNHYGNLFSEDITGGPFLEANPPPQHILIPAEFGNGLVGTTKGLEVSPEWHPFDFWKVVFSYSYLQMDIHKGTNSQDVGSAATVEGSSPKHELTLLTGVDFAKHFSLDLTYRYVSTLPKLSIPSYSTADARLDYKLGEHTTFSIVGRNLLQPYHYEFPSDPGPNVAIKRSAYGQIAWTQ